MLGTSLKMHYKNYLNSIWYGGDRYHSIMFSACKAAFIAEALILPRPLNLWLNYMALNIPFIWTNPWNIKKLYLYCTQDKSIYGFPSSTFSWALRKRNSLHKAWYNARKKVAEKWAIKKSKMFIFTGFETESFAEGKKRICKFYDTISRVFGCPVDKLEYEKYARIHIHFINFLN